MSRTTQNMQPQADSSAKSHRVIDFHLLPIMSASDWIEDEDDYVVHLNRRQHRQHILNGTSSHSALTLDEKTRPFPCSRKRQLS